MGEFKYPLSINGSIAFLVVFFIILITLIFTSYYKPIGTPICTGSFLPNPKAVKATIKWMHDPVIGIVYVPSPDLNVVSKKATQVNFITNLPE